jgi:hypothetical protein
LALVDSFLNLFLGLSGFSCLILQDGIMRSSVLLKEDTVEDKNADCLLALSLKKMKAL